jgi:hypothetical protein
MATPTIVRRHIPNAFKVGDAVKIVSTATTREGGWGTCWTDHMSQLVGCSGTVVASTEGEGDIQQGFSVKVKKDGNEFQYWFPSFSLELVDPKNNQALFKLGDAITVTKKVQEAAGWGASWSKAMDETVGLEGTVMSNPDPKYPGQGYYVRVLKKDGAFAYWYYPSCALSLRTGMKHDAKKFKEGDKVYITRRIDKVPDWENAWESSMDKFVGKVGTIISEGSEIGYDVDFPDSEDTFSFPSAAMMGEKEYLEMTKVMAEMKPNSEVTMAPEVKPEVKAATPVAPIKKKRVRVGAGPWDKAPCSHLRWHLIGFFRSGLSLSTAVTTTKDVAGNPVVVSMAAIKVCCKKCKTSMTMQAS